MTIHLIRTPNTAFAAATLLSLEAVYGGFERIGAGPNDNDYIAIFPRIKKVCSVPAAMGASGVEEIRDHIEQMLGDAMGPKPEIKVHEGTFDQFIDSLTPEEVFEFGAPNKRIADDPLAAIMELLGGADNVQIINGNDILAGMKREVSQKKLEFPAMPNEENIKNPCRKEDQVLIDSSKGKIGWCMGCIKKAAEGDMYYVGQMCSDPEYVRAMAVYIMDMEEAKAAKKEGALN